MSVAVCRSSAAGFESILALSTATFSVPSSRTWLQAPAENEHEYEKQQLDLITKTQEEEKEYVYVNNDQETERPPGQLDILSSFQFQAQKAKKHEAPPAEEPYVHPLTRRSTSLLSQKSLEICTESLGSETGSDEFLSNDETDFFSLATKKEQVQLQQEQDEQADEEEEEFEYVAKSNISNGATNGKEQTTVNYHCSISRRSPQPRSFPPPLPSISRRDGPCLQMRPHRRNGRLVVEAVAVPSQNYLHAERQNGRLLLSFINTSSSYTALDTSAEADPARQIQAQLEEEETIDGLKEEEAQVQAEELEDEEVMMEVEADEEEEEVEVVDRGTVVEVKVTTNPQQNSSGAAKVHRSSIVINKFVSMADDDQRNNNSNEIFTTTAAAAPLSPVRKLSTTTTAAAAAVAASSLSAFSSADGSHSSTTDNKLLFTSRRRNREELLHDMRRCSQLRKPLFIWERCCIATSS